MKRYKELRIRLTAKYKKHNIKGHIGKLENYRFNKTLVREILSAVANGEKDSVTSMTGKWAALAREAGVKKRLDLSQPKTLSARLAMPQNLIFFEIWCLLIQILADCSCLNQLCTSWNLKSMLVGVYFYMYYPQLWNSSIIHRLMKTWQRLGTNECQKQITSDCFAM